MSNEAAAKTRLRRGNCSKRCSSLCNVKSGPSSAIVAGQLGTRSQQPQIQLGFKGDHGTPRFLPWPANGKLQITFPPLDSPNPHPVETADQESASRTEAARRPYRDYGERSFHCVRLAGTCPKTPPPVLPGSFVNASFRFGGVRDVLFVCSSACFAAGFRLNHHL